MPHSEDYEESQKSLEVTLPEDDALIWLKAAFLAGREELRRTRSFIDRTGSSTVSVMQEAEHCLNTILEACDEVHTTNIKEYSEWYQAMAERAGQSFEVMATPDPDQDEDEG